MKYIKNRIEKSAELKAPLAKVWDALTDHNKFGEWFCVKVNKPFLPGQVSHGHVTYPGYEHVKWEAVIQKMEPEYFFSFTWHPYAVDPKVNYSNETPTLVEFKLEKIPKGTLPTVTEIGFEKLPAHRQADAFRMNEEGWEEQLQNIEKYLA
jgi:uncharacterized protein YndB with AHSA1/START domain